MPFMVYLGLLIQLTGPKCLSWYRYTYSIDRTNAFHGTGILIQLTGPMPFMVYLGLLIQLTGPMTFMVYLGLLIQLTGPICLSWNRYTYSTDRTNAFHGIPRFTYSIDRTNAFHGTGILIQLTGPMPFMEQVYLFN